MRILRKNFEPKLVPIPDDKTYEFGVRYTYNPSGTTHVVRYTCYASAVKVSDSLRKGVNKDKYADVEVVKRPWVNEWEKVEM